MEAEFCREIEVVMIGWDGPYRELSERVEVVGWVEVVCIVNENKEESGDFDRLRFLLRP
jgi:hypothetical protein